MIRTLQKRFVVTAMIAITVLLAALLGGINAVNAISSSRQTDSLLQSLAMQEGMGPARPLEHFNSRRGLFEQPMNENTRISAVYFLVRLDAEGAVLGTDLSHIASISEEEAEALALQALALERDSGRLGTLRFQFADTAADCRSVIFLDVSAQRYSVLRVAALSGLAGLAGWILMLILVIALSRRAIRPIAENMERQRQFVTDAGHELKTPLAIILANLDAMELRGGESKYSRNIREQARRLNGLTQNLLTLSRIDESSTLLDAAEFSLSDLTRESLEMFRAPAELKGLTVEAELSPAVTVRASRSQISQLLSILLDNAVKYCPEGGVLTVSLRQEDRAVLRIGNSTAGARVDVERIFDRFYRADSARSQRTGGYGIGLSAAQAIVRLHRGEIAAAYEGEDRLVFTVRL